jgi:calcineurin-like phosphoesterase family protein
MIMGRPKPTFFTSDWHLGHKSALEFDNRPFKNIEEMNQKLVNAYNATVPENGVCYFLGDMGLCSVDSMKKYIDQLNGTKILILGNHDKGPTSMYNIGFDAVMYEASLVIAREMVTMTHCPLRGVFRENTEGMRGTQEGENWHGEFRHQKFSIPNRGQFHLHGHIHSPNRGKSSKILGKQFDVGVTANKYRPVSISVIESWITKYKKENESEL